MSIFDTEVTKFLKTKEGVHICNIDDVKMKFDSKHGYYICSKNHSHIKAPQILIGKKTKQPIKLYWTLCADCGLNNVTDETQEPFWLILKNKKLVKQTNTKQEKIICTHCNKEFLKGK